MSRGVAKGKWDFNEKIMEGKVFDIGCTYEKDSWCWLPKFKRCAYCTRFADGTKACGVKLRYNYALVNNVS